MENLVNIQQEFETLISELERLRGINNLTSSNADSAKGVITKVQDLLPSIQKLKKFIDADYKQKNKQIDLLITKISDSFNSLDTQSKKHASDLSETLKKTHNISVSEIKKSQKDLDEDVKKYIEQLSSLRTSIKQDIEKVGVDTVVLITDKENHLLQEFTQFKNKADKAAIAQSEEINTLKENSQSLKMQLSNLIGAQEKESKNLSTQIKELNHKTTGILVFATIITIGLLIGLALYFK